MADPTERVDPVALSRELDRLLGDQLARVRRRWFVHGLAATLLLPAAVVAIAFLLDHFLRLPLPIRVFHTAIAATAVVLVARRCIVYPLTRTLSSTDIAMLLERAFPELHERLVSSVQLKTALAAESATALRNQSAAMIERLLAETAQQAQALPLDRLFDPRRTARLWAGTAALLLLLTGGALSSPATAVAFVLRHLGRDASYPRATTLLVELPPASAELQRRDGAGTVELVVPAGADLHVSVLAQGVVPDEVLLQVSGSSAGAGAVAMSPRPGGRFRHVFRRIAQGFSFHASGGDDEHGDLTVTVRTIHPPQVAQIKAELRPPAYTRRAPSVQTGGAVEALIGTEVALAVTTTGTVTAAALVFLESGKRLPLELARSTDDAGTTEALVGAFTVTVSDRYQVELLGDGGLRNPAPGTYPVSALQDYAPVGRWLVPDDESGLLLLPEALLCVRGEVRDDFGLRTGALTIDAGGGRTAVRPLLPPADATAAPTTSALVLDLVEVKDVLGAQRTADGLSLQIDLTDNREPEANATQLPRRQVQIVDQAQLAAAIARHFRGLREEVEQAFDLQTDRRTRLQELLQQAPKPGATTATALTAIEVGQGRVQSAADRLLRGTMRAFDLHLWNRLEPSPGAASVVELYRTWHQSHGDATAFQPAFYLEVAQQRRAGAIPAMEQSLDPILLMVQLCHRLATEQSPPVLRLLAEAQVARSAGDLQRLLQKADEGQERIAALLQELLSRLGEWNDYQDLVQEARTLRERQRDVQNRTEQLRGRK